MKRILPLLLCLFLLGGCGQTTQETPDPTFSTLVDLDQLPQEILDTSLESVDVSSSDDDAEARLSQTLGDAMNLYLVGSITFPEALPEDGSLHLPQDVILTANDTPMTYTMRHVGVCPAEGKTDTLNFIFYFGFDREVFRGQEITLNIQDCMGSDFSFTWTPANQGPIRYADPKDEAGDMAGTLNLSSYALNATLWGSPFESNDDLRRSIVLLDENGEEIPLSKVSLGGSNSTIHISFSHPLDPATVKTVQIGPYTAELG